MNATTCPVLDPAVELVAIVEAVRRLTPSWQRPELFHEAKSEITDRLRRLAGLADGQTWPPMSRPTPPTRAVAPSPRLIVQTRVMVLRAHLHRPPRRHRYPKPPANYDQMTLPFPPIAAQQGIAAA